MNILVALILSVINFYENDVTSKIKYEKNADHVNNLMIETVYQDVTYKYLMLPVWFSNFKCSLSINSNSGFKLISVFCDLQETSSTIEKNMIRFIFIAQFDDEYGHRVEQRDNPETLFYYLTNSSLFLNVVRLIFFESKDQQLFWSQVSLC